VLIGTLVPLVSNITPIGRALSKTLRDGLDLYHHVISELTVKIVRLEKMGISLSEFVIALTLIGCGILTFYVAPYALMYNKIKLFFTILNIILMCMILGIIFAFINLFIGLIIICQIISPMLQKGVLWVIMLIMRKDRKLSDCVKTNLKGHMRRNSKTSLMFAIALSFLVFAGSTFELQKNLIISTVEMLYGADLRVLMLDVDDPLGLDEAGIRDYLENLKFNTGFIEDYSFISKELRYTLKVDSSPQDPHIYMGPLCSIYSRILNTQ
jgi:hypothetical protein